ncbi:hypothetical protein CEXT_371311 [Caerostris extrusa]|uniref:Uncharacterized protein n=1 Tax=Caerostris extrusa TaxID=172846 RepID=A0AAV4TV22_CAEEX|nr:hypothetical protein CEXT_371311 [Caerostris extrusa]
MLPSPHAIVRNLHTKRLINIEWKALPSPRRRSLIGALLPSVLLPLYYGKSFGEKLSNHVHIRKWVRLRSLPIRPSKRCHG